MIKAVTSYRDTRTPIKVKIKGDHEKIFAETCSVVLATIGTMRPHVLRNATEDILSAIAAVAAVADPDFDRKQFIELFNAKLQNTPEIIVKRRKNE